MADFINRFKYPLLCKTAVNFNHARPISKKLNQKTETINMADFICMHVIQPQAFFFFFIRKLDFTSQYISSPLGGTKKGEAIWATWSKPKKISLYF